MELTNHIKTMYLVTVFSSSRINLESYTIIEQGFKNHLIVSQHAFHEYIVLSHTSYKCVVKTLARLMS